MPLSEPDGFDFDWTSGTVSLSIGLKLYLSKGATWLCQRDTRQQTANQPLSWL